MGKMGLFPSTRVAQGMAEERLSGGLAVRATADAQHWVAPRNERMACIEQGGGPLWQDADHIFIKSRFCYRRAYHYLKNEARRNAPIEEEHTGWVIGHLFGYVLLGIALLWARTIPRWAAWLLIVSAPIMGPLAYGTGLGLLQVLGYILVFIASVPAALAILTLME